MPSQREKRLPLWLQCENRCIHFLKPRKRKSDEVNILGYFSPLQEDCELYSLLKGAGVRKIREISRCESFEEYEQMSQANFSLVLNAEARYAAQQMEQELNIPFYRACESFQADKISTQYRLLGQAIGAELCDKEYYEQTMALIDDFREKHKGLCFAVGEVFKLRPYRNVFVTYKIRLQGGGDIRHCGGAKFRLCEKR